ncbi:MAG: 16S rRNA (cytidine(1402)-2'-O)-methyltransferase [Alphaproteobacteria bacterium]|nr:16S rRNA (cytidine(1402)-2'-O)-methyltransferase [Alphaproteobacteria bacterium]
MPLFIIATPIGNLADVSLRSLEMLAACDQVLCEDTRVAKQLLVRHAVAAKVRPYHDHNAAEVRPAILALLQEGASIGLMSDAGTPLIADPGYRLVTEAIAAGIVIVPIPGACAITTALCCAGLPTDRFYFGGFLPRTEHGVRKELGLVAELPATLVFYESPHRIVHQVSRLATMFPTRYGVLGRELTKKFESIYRGTLPSLAELVASGTVSIKGEFVVMLASEGYVPPWHAKVA